MRLLWVSCGGCRIGMHMASKLFTFTFTCGGDLAVTLPWRVLCVDDACMQLDQLRRKGCW